MFQFLFCLYLTFLLTRIVDYLSFKGDKPKLSKEELEELIAECEALKNGDKRDDDPSLEEVCMALAKNKVGIFSRIFFEKSYMLNS